MKAATAIVSGACDEQLTITVELTDTSDVTNAQNNLPADES